MRRVDSFEKTLMLGKIEGRRRGQERVRWLDGISDSMDMILSMPQPVTLKKLKLNSPIKTYKTFKN